VSRHLDKNNGTTGIFLVIVLLGFSGSAFAGLAACNGATYNLGTGANGLLPGGDTSAGCEQIDKQFSGFNYTPGSNPVAGSAVPTVFQGSADAGPIGVQFGAIVNNVGTWEANGTTTVAQTTSASVSYTITVDPTPPPAFAPPPGQQYAIDAMTLSENASLNSGFPVGVSDSITLFEYFCAGPAGSCAGGGSGTGGINLSSATAGFLVYFLSGNGNGYTANTSTCFNNGNTNSSTDCQMGAASVNYVPNSSLVNFLASSYSLGFNSVSTFSTLVVTSQGDKTDLNFFTENYFQELNVPEPGTFGLIGAALAGLGFVGLRRRKQRV
jgi:hypothetical protein